MDCTYPEENSGCPTGVQIVTGTTEYGGCTYVGGCSTIDCETPGPTSTPPPGSTPTPTPPGCVENCGCDFADLGCNQFVSTDGTSWTKDPIYVAGGAMVYFKMEINNFKKSIDWFGIRNYFSASYDGYTNIAQNDDEPGAGVAWNIYTADMPPGPGIYWDAHYEDWGGFNPGMVSTTTWWNELNSNAQTFKNMGFAAYGGYVGGCADVPAGWRNCWQDPESGGLTCITYPDGCGTTWANCPYDISFECNKVTVNTTYPISGWVKDSYSGNGISGTEISVYDGNLVQTRTATTDGAGHWEIRDFVRPGDAYAVRVSGAPAGYGLPPKTSTLGWTWNTWTSSDTPLGSLSYESQQAGNNDCAGKDGSGVDDRCNFVFNSPYGYFDWANCSQFTGWTCDADNYNTALQVDLWTFDSAGRGTYIGWARADVAREPGVAAACGNNPNHGFVYSLPAESFLKDGVNHNIYAYGLNIGGGANTLLTNSPKIINCAPPPVTWTINAEPVCLNGLPPTGQTRTFYKVGLTADWNYGSFGTGTRTQGITGARDSNPAYIGLMPDVGTILNTYGSSPNPAIEYGTYFSPPIPMARWTSSALPGGTYNLQFQAPDSFCAPPPSCTSVSCSPNPMPLFPEQATGRTLTPTVNGLSNGTISNVSYSSSNNGVATVNSPSSVSPFQTTVNPNARGSTTITATANLSSARGTGSCQGTCTNVSVGGCSVSLSASSVTNPNPVSASFTGRSPNSGTEPVRLFLKSQDGLIDEFLTSCDSVNGSTCSGAVTISGLPAGDYYVHCDLPNDPDKCTGNPFGVPAGWESCSTNDNAALTVADPAPTCTGVTLLPDPMPLFPEQLTGRTLTPTVSGISYGSISSVEYSSDDPSVATVTTPSSVSPFQSTVGTPGLRGSATVNTTANLSGPGGTGSCTGTGTVNVGGCSVSLSAPSMLSNGSVNATYTGRSPNSEVTEPVRLWLKSADGSIDQMLDSCDSVNGSTCSGAYAISGLEAGDYYVHCDIPNGSPPIDPQCTGNPFCVFEGMGGADPCTGWESCSTTDNAALTVAGVPTCTVNGYTLIYTDETGEFNSSAQVAAGGNSDVEIDRSRDGSVADPSFAQLLPGYTTCGNPDNVCVLPLATWAPTSADVGAWKVFCRGYNAAATVGGSPLECRPFPPNNNYPAGPWVGDCSINPLINDDDYLDVTVELPPPWFQTMGGDVFASGGDLYTRIPAGATSPYFSLDKDGYPGVVLAKGEVGFGPNFNKYDAVSSKKWLVEGESYSFTERYDYNYLLRKISGSETIQTLENTPTSSRWKELNGNYQVEGDGNLTVISGTTNVGGTASESKVVIFVPGDLTINGNIKRAASGPQKNFVAFIVQGNIIIDGGVSGNSGNPAIEGIYLANGEIRTGDDSADPGQLYAQGLFIAWDGFDFQRTWRGPAEDEPAEVFEYDVDLVMDAPDGFLNTPLVWTEVAP
ncbi:MAG: carboxypeptidase-like regulatory domain-containing protein [Dehalococcoidia bacterium]|nr:carboxypeptidase-like regulatory domain-containing protein [Dehalococcoidia bacterium]